MATATIPLAGVGSRWADPLGRAHVAALLRAAAMLGQKMARDRTSAMRDVLIRAGFDEAEVDQALQA